MLLAAWSRLESARETGALLKLLPVAAPTLLLMAMAMLVGLFVITFPFYLSVHLGLGMDVFGTALLFYVAAASLTAPLAGLAADRLGALRTAWAGGVMSALALLSMLGLTASDGAWDLMWRMALLGAATGLCNPAIMTAVLDGTPEHKAGTAGGLANSARAIGQVLGPPVCAYIWSAAGGGSTAFVLTIVGGATLVALTSLLGAVVHWRSRTRSRT